ncbi:MAG: O-antigen ligase family protein [Verrucomicrobia bacterium]|nr:O-antigen ligase family protein [Verrucomicrobiota bacterium]
MENSVSYPAQQTKEEGRTFRVSAAIEWLLLLMMAYFPFQKRFSNALKAISYSFVPSNVDLPSFFSKKMDFYFTDLIILLSVGLCLYRRRHAIRSFLFSGPAKFLMVFFVTAVLSVVCSITADYAIQYYRLMQFFLFLLLFCALADTLKTTQSEQLVKRILWVFWFTALAECGIGIAQYFLQSPLGLKFFGEVNMVIFQFPMKGGYRWIIDEWTGYISNRTILSRCSGTFTHPNILGGFVFVSLLLTYYFIVAQEKKAIRRLLYGAIFIQVFTLSISFSRAAIVATVIGSCVWFVVSIKKFVNKNKWKSLFTDALALRRIYVIATVMVSTLVCLSLFYNQFFHRGGIVNYNQISSDADKERIVYQNIAWEMFKDHPIVGGGFNNFQILSRDYASEGNGPELFAKVHNIYLLILAETGLLGAGAFLLFLISLFRRVLKRSEHEATRVLMSIFAGFLFIGLCDYYFLHTHHGKCLFFVFAALLQADLLVSKKTLQDEDAGVSDKRIAQS